MKIALIMPPQMTYEKGFNPVKCSYAGLGIVHIASYLQNSGYDVQIVDLSGCDLSHEEDIRKISSFDVYGIGMYTESALSVDILCKTIRKNNPDAKMIIGGHHATNEWKSILAEYPYTYAVVIGDGEIPMKRLVDGIAAGSYNRDFAGVAYKTQAGEYINHGKYINRDLRDVELNLKWLKKVYVCFPLLEYARRLFPQHSVLLAKYLERNLYREGCQSAGIITSRGCNVKCSFCTFEISMGFNKHRMEYVSDMFEWYARNGISNLIFYDSTFLADLQHIEEMCKLMICSKYNFKWTAQTQVHHEDKSIIKLMAQAGLVQMNLGLESGSPTIIHEMNKRFDIDEFPEVVEAYQQAGVGVCANLIIGSPGENDQTIRETCRLFYHVDTDVIGEVQDLKLYPGSKWCRKSVREGFVSKEWSWKERGIPQFIFHDEMEIERWRITMEAHLRYAAVFNNIAKKIDNIVMLGFPEQINTALLVEALEFAFPGCSVNVSLKPACANLVLYFSPQFPRAEKMNFTEKDLIVWCSLEEKVFKLEIAQVGSFR